MGPSAPPHRVAGEARTWTRPSDSTRGPLVLSSPASTPTWSPSASPASLAMRGGGQGRECKGIEFGLQGRSRTCRNWSLCGSPSKRPTVTPNAPPGLPTQTLPPLLRTPRCSGRLCPTRPQGRHWSPSLDLAELPSFVNLCDVSLRPLPSPLPPGLGRETVDHYSWSTPRRTPGFVCRRVPSRGRTRVGPESGE